MKRSAETQQEKSGGRRPWLNDEVERLADEAVILKVQLYDAAQWYLPNELPALIDELDLENRATEEVALFLRAKLRLARATSDEEKLWLQMTAPRHAPPNPEPSLRKRVFPFHPLIVRDYADSVFIVPSAAGIEARVNLQKIGIAVVGNEENGQIQDDRQKQGTGYSEQQLLLHFSDIRMVTLTARSAKRTSLIVALFSTIANRRL